MATFVEFGRVRHPGGHAQPMAQRTGRQLDARYSLVGHVTGQKRAVRAMLVQQGRVEKAGFGQSRVNARARVPLAEDESVAIRI